MCKVSGAFQSTSLQLKSKQLLKGQAKDREKRGGLDGAEYTLYWFASPVTMGLWG